MKHVKPICIGLLSLCLIILAVRLVVTYARGLSGTSAQVPPLLHDGQFLVVPEQSPLRKLIAIKPVVQETVAAPFTLPAIVEAIPTNEVKIFPPLLGRITRLNKRLGDSVKRGDVLFTLNSPELAQARSDIERAQSAFLLAKQNFTRQQQLIAAHIGAQREIEQAQNDYDQTASELARAEARLKELKLEPEATNPKHLLVVRSPRSGYVIELNASVGEFWNDTTASLMTVADLSSVYVTASAQEKDLNELYLGQKVNITFDAYPQPYSSSVHFISQILDPNTRTADVTMLFKNPKGQFKPNMFAKAVFTRQPQEQIVLPLTAVIQRGFDSIVFVERGPWQFEARRVKLGPQLGRKVEVLSGLKVNERIVIKGGIVLND